MQVTMLVRVALKALRRNLMRSILTALGVIIGVSAVICTVAIGEGAAFKIREAIASIGDNVVWLEAGGVNRGGVRTGSGGTKSLTLTARIRYADGSTEDHPLRNGVHFADYIRRVDVPGSKFAFALRGQQIRYLAIRPMRSDPVAAIDFVRGSDVVAPIIMAMTLEFPATPAEKSEEKK